MSLNKEPSDSITMPETPPSSPRVDQKRPQKALALFFAVAFFADYEFELEHLSDQLNQKHLWRSSPAPDSEDVMIVSNGACVPNLRSAFHQADKAHPNMLQNNQGVYKIDTEKVIDYLSRYRLPNLDDWRLSHDVHVSKPILSHGT